MVNYLKILDLFYYIASQCNQRCFAFLDFLLKYNILRFCGRQYFRLLGFIFIMMEKFSKLIGLENLNLFIMTVVVIVNRLNIALPFFYGIILLMSLESQRRIIGNYYRSRPTIFLQHFPESKELNRRKMHKIAQAIIDTSQTPLVKASIVVFGGMITWKYLDIYQLGHEKDLQDSAHKHESAERELDRQNSNEQARLQRLHDAEQQQKNRESAERMHRETLATDTKKSDGTK
jgi:hypothetical protein